jgi:hypothetical protein
VVRLEPNRRFVQAVQSINHARICACCAVARIIIGDGLAHPFACFGVSSH